MLVMVQLDEIPICSLQVVLVLQGINCCSSALQYSYLPADTTIAMCEMVYNTERHLDSRKLLMTRPTISPSL